MFLRFIFSAFSLCTVWALSRRLMKGTHLLVYFFLYLFFLFYFVCYVLESEDVWFGRVGAKPSQVRHLDFTEM